MNGGVEKLFLFALSLQNSTKYHSIKAFVYNIFENDHFYYKKFMDIFLIFLVMVSTGLYLYNIRHENSGLLELTEWFTVAIFTIEYLARLWVSSSGHQSLLRYFGEKNETGTQANFLEAIAVPSKEKVIFMLKPLSVIDLVSIFPALQILRVFKLFRYSEGARNFFSVFKDKRQEVAILGMLIAIAIFMSSALFYVFEQNNKGIDTFFDAIYWSSITISTVGYGDISPITKEGRLVAIILVFSGLGVIAMLTSLVTTGLSQKISELKEQKNVDSSKRLESFIIIAGFGDMGTDLASRLYEAKMPFIIFDKDEEKVKNANDLGYYALHYDATKPSCLKDIKIDQKATAIACLTNSDITNISISIAARSIGYSGYIVARAVEARNEDKMRLVGVNSVISHAIGANSAIQCFDNPVLHKIATSLVNASEGIGIEEIKLTGIENHINIEELELEGLGCVLLGIFCAEDEDNFIFNPPLKEIKLYKNSTLIVFGKTKRIESLRMAIAKIGGSK
jgi:voltage-gated potassium channel